MPGLHTLLGVGSPHCPRCDEMEAKLTPEVFSYLKDVLDRAVEDAISSHELKNKHEDALS